MGVANNHSLAWGIANLLYKNGAELAYTYQGDSFKKRVEPLAKKTNSNLIFNCDVTKTKEIEDVFSAIEKEWKDLDFIVHGIAYSDRNELTGRYLDTSKENFLKTLEISCYSLTEITRIAEPYINEGGSILTLSFGGSVKVMPNYNVMGLAKASLEANTRFLAASLGKDKIRVNAISAGPIKTLAASGVKNFRKMLSQHSARAPLGRTVTQEEVGNTAAFLCSDLASGITGEITYVDAGFNIAAMPLDEGLE